MNMEQLLLAGSKGQDLKRQRGRRSTEEEGSKRSLARSLAHSLSPLCTSPTHTRHAWPAQTQTERRITQAAMQLRDSSPSQSQKWFFFLKKGEK